MEGQPIEVRAEFWRMYMEDIKEWRAIFRNMRGSDG